MIDDSVLVILGEDELMQDTILISAMKPEQIRMELSKSLEEQEMFVDKIVRKMLVEERSYRRPDLGFTGRGPAERRNCLNGGLT